MLGQDKYFLERYRKAERVELTAEAGGSTYTLGVNERVVLVDASNGTYTITLPSVAEAQGLMFHVLAVDGTNNITIQDNNNDAGLSDITLNADDEEVLLISTGYSWFYVMRDSAGLH